MKFIIFLKVKDPWFHRSSHRSICREGSRVCCQVEGVQATLLLDHWSYEPAGRAAPGARPQVEPQVRDRGSLQEAEPRDQ